MGLHFKALLRLLPFVVTLGVLSALLATGCGRSDLLADSLTLDGGFGDGGDGGSCGPLNCPTGCCDSFGKCRAGTDTQACGEFGARCSDCLGQGFTSCDPGTHACQKSVTDCNADTCGFGCCIVTDTGGTLCVGGTDATQCGASGASCTDCTQFGDICDFNSRSCQPSGCNANNCGDGCCIGGDCQHGGNSDTACGLGGVSCDDCAVRGQTCAVDPGGNATCVGMPACGPNNCAGGCCIGDVCVGGSDDTACGGGGGQCANCAGKNQVCGAGQTCQTSTCSAANCPGCCQGNACVLQTTDQACGKAGAKCAPCGATQTCTGGTCVTAPTCGPATCATGCCQGGVCAIGTQPTVCGTAGATCANCSAQGLTCTGQACVKPVCSPANCAGCCSNGTCVLGTQDAACGNGGAACTDCGAQALVCGAGGVCKAPCGPANCPTGCCSGQSCVGGFINNRCGSNGAACIDCTQNGATCDTAANPRACTAPNTCPQKYTTCAAGVTTAVPTQHQNACAATDLQDAASACTAGLSSAPCQAYIQFLVANSPTCATCLAPFEHDYNATDYAGVYTCIAPFVGAPCNHSTGCEIDCEVKSCAMCSAGDDTACENNVQGNGGQCFTFEQQSQCIDMAISGPPGNVCDPFSNTYNFGDFGLFLAGMGKQFCRP